MDEITARDDRPSQDKAFLRDDALPAKDGGGAVFPEHAFGPAFRLDEWSFIRYCTRQSEREFQEARKSSRRKDREMLLRWAGSLAVAIALGWATQLIELNPDRLFTAYGIFLIGFLLVRSFRAPEWFSTGFPDARAIPFRMKWRLLAQLDAARRSLGALWQRGWRVALPLLMAATVYTEHAEDVVINFVVAALLGLAAAEGLVGLAFLRVYLPRRFGRAAAKAEPEPL